MNRCVVLVGRMLVVVAIIMSFAVARPGSAEGLNSLAFSFEICPEWEDTCQPYGNTEARIMEVATGAEQWATNDALGWAGFGHLVDGDYNFSTPSVVQKSITFNCADESGAVVPSWMGDNGPTVSLAGGHSVACAGIMVPFGPADVDEAPVDAGVDVPEIGFVNSFIYECPAGAEGQQLNLICDSPSQPYTAYLTSGTVPNQTTLEQVTGSNGAAYFDVTPGNLNLWPGVDTATQTIVSASCTATISNNAGSLESSDFVPSLGGAGYQFSVAADTTVECFFYVVIEDLPTVDQSDSAILSVYTSECPVGYTGSDYASDCGNPVDASIYTAFISYGTVPNLATLEAALNEYGYATFGGLPADHYSVMVGSESATVGAVSCDIFDASGSGDATSIAPNLGGSGYELDLVEGGAADCYFAMIPVGTDTPSTTPSASDEPATSDEPTTSAAPSASDEPATSDKPAASATAKPSAQASVASGTTTTLPNTGSGVSSNGADTTTTFALIGLVFGSVLLLLVAVGIRRSSAR